jgi:hypothetical protein
LLRSRLAWIAGMAAVLAVAIAGVGAAAIPSAGGTINACYDGTGKMRLIDTEGGPGTAPGSCGASEKALSWNQKGPTGPAGPKGATGPQGPAGPSFARGHFRNGWHEPTADAYRTFARVDMPKGLHIVSGKAIVHMREAWGHEYWAAVTCRLAHRRDEGVQVLDKSVVEVSDGGPEYATLSLEGLAVVDSASDPMRLQCIDDGGPGGLLVELKHIKLITQEVGGWTAKAEQ